MTNEERKVFELALEALENLMNQHYAEQTTSNDLEKAERAITAIKEALAQPKFDYKEHAEGLQRDYNLLLAEYSALKNQPDQEPFTHYRHYDGGLQEWPDEKTIPLYTTPPQRKPLTDEQIKHLAIDVYSPHQEPLIVFARAIEAAHGIK